MIERWIVDDVPSTQYPIYTRANVGEVFPLPVSPLTWTMAAHPCSEPGWRDALVRYGALDLDEFDPDRLEILGCFGGYAYLNVSITRIVGVRTPGLTPEQVDYSLWGEMPGVPPYRPSPSDERPANTERIQQTMQWILTATELPELVEDQRLTTAARARRPNLAALTDRELIGYVEGNLPEIRRLFSQHLFISMCALVPLGIISGTCAAIGDPTLAMRLVGGIGGVDSAAPSWAMWRLGRMTRSSPSLTEAFTQGIPGLDQRVRAASDPDAVAFVKGFDQFLFDFGSRGPNEWETSSPSWETRPELALAAIDRMRLSGDDADPELHHSQLSNEREMLGPKLVEELAADPAAQQQFAAALHAAPLFLAGRERSKTNVIRIVNENRVALVELGRRMVEAGVFDRIETAAQLRAEELEAFLTDPASFADELRSRERAYAELFDLEPPFIIDGVVPPLVTWRRRGTSGSRALPGTTLAGIPGCPGKATGRARVVLDPADPSALEPGDVLVAPITDPAWTPLFVPAAAVIVDVGAQLSHAVIVSRELGIPCVVSVTDATRTIPDGATVTVDGTTGTVTIH